MNKSKLFKLAHAIRSQFDSFSEALRQSWKVLRLKLQMAKREVKFQYRKVDGSIRDAVGTLDYEVKGTGKPSPVDSFVYFDVAVGGVRSCKIINIL